MNRAFRIMQATELQGDVISAQIVEQMSIEINPYLLTLNSQVAINAVCDC